MHADNYNARIFLCFTERQDIHKNVLLDEGNKSIPQSFDVNQLKNILKEEIGSHGGVIVNYDMTTLGQVPGYGHFGLAVALAKSCINNKEVYFILLLDPWPETPIAWVPLDLMFKAMNTVDNASGKHRGFLLRKVNLQP